MRKLRGWWRRLRGWWLLVLAAAATAILSAVGKEYTGLAAAVVVAVGGVVAAVLSERGRAQLSERAKVAAISRSSLYLMRVDRLADPIRLGVHPAAVLERTDGGIDRVPPFIERDRSPELAEALRVGGFVLLVGDSTAGKTRLAYETMRACLPDSMCIVPENSDALSAAVAAAGQNRPSVLWLDDLERYLVGGLTRADLAEVVDGKAAAALADCLGDGGHEMLASTRLETIIAEAEASGQVSTYDLLQMRNRLAWMVGGKTAGRGDSERGMHIAQDVVRDSIRSLGDDHPATLFARLTLARQLGDRGATQEALALAEQVAADATRSHGPSHETTLSARFEVAVWTMMTEGAHAGAQHFANLLTYAESAKSAPLALIADCRWNLGGALLDTGDAAGAVDVLAMAVVQASQVFGAEHRRTLDIQLSHVDAIGAAGDRRQATVLAAQLVLDCVQHLGENNPTTRDARELANRLAAE